MAMIVDDERDSEVVIALASPKRWYSWQVTRIQNDRQEQTNLVKKHPTCHTRRADLANHTIRSGP
jgi:hypothetical protein